MSKNDVPMARPKSTLDKQLARLEAQRIWEEAPRAVARETARLAEIDRIAAAPDASPSLKLKCIELGHRIDRETFLDRTVPTLQRVAFSGTINPMAPQTATGPTEMRAALAELVQELRADPSLGRVRAVDAEYTVVENGEGKRGG
jgi:hypothetical protein